MFTVTVSGAEYLVKFYHHNTPEFVSSERGTQCVIRNVETEAILADEISRLHPKDQYNKNIGRKVSLSHAIRNSFPNKEDRQKIWDVYFATRGGKYD